MNFSPKHILLPFTFSVAGAALASFSYAAETPPPEVEVREKQTVEALQQRIEELEITLNERLESLADAVEANPSAEAVSSNRVHIGGYGEMHYNNLSIETNSETPDQDFRQLELHRMVLFIGYEFNDWARFITEFEVEHVLVSDGARGAVEIEQAYVELDLQKNMHLKTGVLLAPLGIINETHEPPTFYGVERPIIETTIIPTTWYGAGASLKQSFDNGVTYDLMVSEGLKTDDPTSNPNAEPFNLKQGKQKASFAAAYDMAVTARVAYRGIKGLELSGYTQYQPDLDQSAEISYADAATLVGGHAIYQWDQFTAKALYARWQLDGDAAADAGKDVQDGGYIELAWKPAERWGLFARQSEWSQTEGESNSQTDIGVSFLPLEDVVFKADYQFQSGDTQETQGFNLGVGYQF
jgi:hypothetical protein